MSAISTILTRLRAAIWAIDVRDDIANAIEQCYSDVSNPTLKTEALEAALQTKIDEGEMAALTIGDHTITAAKLAQDVIDNTLATSGAAADAKKTGDEITALKADLGAIFPGEYTVRPNIYINTSTSALGSVSSGSFVICIQAEPNKSYKIVKKTSTIMRVGAGSSPSLQALDPLINVTGHTENSTDALFIDTDSDNYYLYIQLYTNAAASDLRSIEANLPTLSVSENIVSELSELKNTVNNIVPGLSEDAKTALLNCIAHIGIWSDEPGEYYYNALEAALNGTPLETWTYEWNYTDGLPEANGMSKTITGESSSEITSNGLLMQAEDASGMKVQYAYYDVDSTKEYVKGIYEFVFTINTFGSYNTAPYGNGVQIWLGMGQRNGNPVNCAELTFNQGGVLHLITVNDSGTWETIDSTPFVTGREYSIRCEQNLTETKVYVDGTLAGTIPASSHREALSSQVFLTRRCSSVTVKRFRFKLSEV